MKSEKKTSRFSTLRRMYALLGIFVSSPKYWVIIVLVGVLPMAWQYGYAKPFGLIIQYASEGESGLYLRVLLLLIALFVLLSFAQTVFGYLLRWLQLRLRWAIRKDFFAHVMRLPVRFFADTHSGEIVSRLSNDVRAMTETLATDAAEMCETIIGGLFALIIIGIISWQAVIVAVVFGGVNLVFHILAMKPKIRLNRIGQKALGESNRVFTDIVSGVKVIRMFGLRGWMTQEYNNTLHEVRTAMIRRGGIVGVQTFLWDVTRWCSMVGMMLVATVLVARGRISISDIVVVSTIGGSITQQLATLSYFLGDIQYAISGAERAFELRDETEEALNAILPTEPALLSPDLNTNAVNFQSVCFHYTPGSPVLQDISFGVEKGKMIAIVGRSGGGKSTLFKILMGFYQPISGAIHIFEKRYGDFSMEELRSCSSYVPQQNYLFDGTIRENILVGKPDAKEYDLVEAAKAAEAHGFISSMEYGYDSEVGERGGLLSGGERQRVAIARALLKDAPILLLDEATASLDTESERQVQMALERLMVGRTTIVVAHRLATVRSADNILVLEEGRITESGTHDELIALNQRYAFYYNLQFVGQDTG